MNSSPAKSISDAEGREGKDKKGLGKVLSNFSRMKTILKKQPGESSRRHSDTHTTQSEASGSQPTRYTDISSHVQDADYVETPEYMEAYLEPTARRQSPIGATRVPRMHIHEERARTLNSEYDVTIEPSDFYSLDEDVYRVEKPVRVRIHRNCHRCHTSFGTGSQCPNCTHVYCSKCGRAPGKRTESQKHSGRAKREEAAQRQQELAPITPHYGMGKPITVTRPSKTGGQPLVHKPPRMRVRRNCHRCNTLYPSSNRTCERCGHRRCDDCPKSPNKRKKYPYGYPGDEPGPNSSSFHMCHECREKFPPNAEDGYQCASCDHQKCPTCPRVPRVKVISPPDPELLRGISSRFEQLEVS